MEWKLPKLKQAEKVEEEPKDPVSIDDIEKTIELINTAHKIEAMFKAAFELPLDTLDINSTTFESIKLQKSKNKENKIVIKYATPIMSTETTIDVNNVYGIIVEISFTNTQMVE